MRLPVVIALLAVSLHGQDDAWQLTLRLSRVKRQVKAALQNQPDYTCVATFDRYHWPINQADERQIDTVRVEVAYVGRRELYSWPGEGKFSEKPLGRMVGAGLMGDGDFAVHANNLFVGDNGVVTYAGEEEQNGRKFSRWDYKMSPYQSGWTLWSENNQQLVGAQGSFWVDSQTLDLVKMVTNATDILDGFPMKSVTSTVFYGRVPIGDQQVLLPLRGELKTISRNGDESRNVSTYDNCRQFAGQSTISFGAAPAPEESAPPKEQAIEERVPAGLTLQIRLNKDVSLERATVGDAVEGVLLAALRDGTREIAPKGAVVRGRLRLLRKDDREFVEMGLSFDELEFKGHVARFAATLKSFDSAAPGVRRNRIADRNYTETALTWKELTATKLPGASVFFLDVGSFGLRKGTEMTWVTE